MGKRCFRYAKPQSKKPNATKHGKTDYRTMANIGRRCTIEIADGCIPERNCPLVSIPPSVDPGDLDIIDDFGVEVGRCSTLRTYTAKGTPPFEP